MIKNKQEMYNLYESGSFGNRFKCWPNLWSWANDPASIHPINFRYKGKGSGGFFIYGLNPDIETVSKAYCRIILDGVSPNHIHVTEGDNGDYGRLMQGEIMRSGKNYYAYLSTVQATMRTALETGGIHLEGENALKTTIEHMDEVSRKNLHRLFKEYPEHVIEFTTYNKPVGMLGWNTVFWEVRYY